jgi:DNA-binding MltR family transcriptional regulator
MSWIIGDNEEEEFISQLQSLPDRIVGLLAPAIIEKRLGIVIQSIWADTPKGDLQRDLFRDGGPLGSFATRIQVGFAIRIYGLDAYDDLRDINKIRNFFAHDLKAKDFNVDFIRDRAKRLRLPSKFPSVPFSAVIETKNDLFEMILSMTKHSVVGQGTDPRSLFLRTTEILAIMLWAEIYIASNSDIAPADLPPMPRF